MILPRIHALSHRHAFTFPRLALIPLFLVGLARLAALPAFPGAEGFGANSTGGRGGSVYIVTNLDDTGPGSFRDAVSQPNRYVVFAVGGVIKITSRIVVKNNVTIAGQTAPGEGITIYGNGLSYSGANHSITRYLRIRMGVGGDSGKDALTIANGSNMIFDHVTIAWGRDETFSISGENPSNITIQDSMIAMGLQTHSAGGLIQTDGGVSIIRTLYIDNHTRNPKVKGVNEFINSVVYNWGGGGAYILGDSAGPSYANIVNNYFISGPNTSIAPFTRGNLNFHVYAAENYHDSNRNGTLDGALIPDSGYTTVDFQAARYPYPTVSKLLTPAEAYAHVAAHAGASKTRDRVDLRYIAELTSLGTLGQIPTNENDAPINGAGPVAGGLAPVDTDLDGMPDAWELATGTNPAAPDHNGDLNGDGYTNLEEYLNALAPAAVQGVAFTGVGTDSGSSASDGITSDPTIILNGTAEAGATVTLTRLGTGVIGTTTATPAGTWSFDYTGTTLPQGAHPFTATATTTSGWTSPPTPAFVVTVDNVAPAAPQIGSITVSAGNLVFNGSAEAGARVVVTRVGAGVVGTATADVAGVWSANDTGPALAPGIHSFTAAATDRAGNAGVDSAPYVVDTTLAPPALASITTDTGSLATDLITNDPSLLLHGTGPAGATVSITRSGVGVIGNTLVGADGVWTFDYSATVLPAGAHRFSATASNGGVSSPSSNPFVVTVDTTRPVVTAIARLNPFTAATVASNLTWRVTFSESVSGVDGPDFTLTAAGAAGTIASVSASSGTTFDVTVSGVSGDGTLRLNLASSGTGIFDVAGNAINTGFTTGQTYTIRLPGSGVWISTESGDLWSDPFSWEAGMLADGVGATADFATLDPDASLVVQLDSSRTLGRLIFGDVDTSSPASWTVDLLANPASQINLAAASGAPSIVVNALGSGATATLEVGLSSTTGLTKSGAGTAVLSGANAISGPLAVTAGVLRVGGGGTLASSTVAINSGGSKLEVATGGTYTASGLVTITAGGSSGVLVSGGHATFNGGIITSNTRDARVQVTGGTLNATSIDFPRSNDNSQAYSNGIFIQGGLSNVGTIALGTADSFATMSIENGALNVSGPVTVGWMKNSGSRGGLMRVTGGVFNSTDPVDGLVLSRRNAGNPGTSSGVATFSGGTSTVEKIQLAYNTDTTGGSARLEVLGGTLYVGGGGILRSGAGSFSTTVTLNSGTLGAHGDWASAVPMTFGGNITLRAADALDAPRDITLNGVLGGSGGFTKTGAGTLALSAANTFAGSVNVNAGTLRLTGSLAAGGPITLNGGTLVGTGTINKPVVLHTATIAADATTPLVLGGGALTWNGGGRLALPLGANGSSGRLAISGPLTKGAAGSYAVAFDAGAGFAAGNTYTLATFASTDFAAADFSATGLPAGFAAAFSLTATTLNVTIIGTPFITSPVAASGTFGTPFSYAIAAGNGPTSFGATGLPAGLSLDPLTGIISGTPVATGTFNATLRATNLAGTGTAALTLTIAQAAASIALADLKQAYDGTPQIPTATTHPAGLNVTFTYNGGVSIPTLPGTYAVSAAIDDPNYRGSVTDTLVVTITALVRHAPALSGDVDGSVQVLLPESMTLNGGAMVSGDLLVPGSPTVQRNGNPTYGSTIDAGGATTPAAHAITLNGGAVLRHVVRRVDAIALPTVDAPPPPAGTRDVSLHNANQSPGDFATLRNLTLNGNAGTVIVPPGAYGSFTANGGGFILGLAGATEPSVYALQSLRLNGASQLQIAGPVILTLASGASLDGNSGAAAHPEWLTLRLAAGNLTLNGNAVLHGHVVAPSGAVTLNGNSTMNGSIAADRLAINGNALLKEAP